MVVLWGWKVSYERGTPAGAVSYERGTPVGAVSYERGSPVGGDSRRSAVDSRGDIQVGKEHRVGYVI